jgi:hypothetical protein
MFMFLKKMLQTLLFSLSLNTGRFLIRLCFFPLGFKGNEN